MRARLPLLLIAALFAACGGGAGRSADMYPSERSHDPNVIAEDELREASGQTLFDVVRALRPAWLRSRGPTTLLRQNEGALVVYVDGVRFGDMDSLRQLTPRSVRSARFYHPTDAQARFGPGHLQGAIEVTTLAR